MSIMTRRRNLLLSGAINSTQRVHKRKLCTNFHKMGNERGSSKTNTFLITFTLTGPIKVVKLAASVEGLILIRLILCKRMCID